VGEAPHARQPPQASVALADAPRTATSSDVDTGHVLGLGWVVITACPARAHEDRRAAVRRGPSSSSDHDVRRGASAAGPLVLDEEVALGEEQGRKHGHPLLGPAEPELGAQRAGPPCSKRQVVAVRARCCVKPRSMSARAAARAARARRSPALARAVSSAPAAAGSPSSVGTPRRTQPRSRATAPDRCSIKLLAVPGPARRSQGSSSCAPAFPARTRRRDEARSACASRP